MQLSPARFRGVQATCSFSADPQDSTDALRAGWANAMPRATMSLYPAKHQLRSGGSSPLERTSAAGVSGSQRCRSPIWHLHVRCPPHLSTYLTSVTSRRSERTAFAASYALFANLILSAYGPASMSAQARRERGRPPVQDQDRRQSYRSPRESVSLWRRGGCRVVPKRVRARPGGAGADERRLSAFFGVFSRDDDRRLIARICAGTDLRDILRRARLLQGS